jgi:hypothetical protein
VLRFAVLAAVVVIAAIGVAVVASGSEDARLTPTGRSTVWSPWVGPVTTEGRHSDVLVAVRIRVGAGGRAGRVRLRVVGGAPGAGVRLGGTFALPARPGTYTFPAPHVRWDYRDGEIALDQQTGGHAIVGPAPCDAPEEPCSATLESFVPALAGTASPARARPSERREGRQLTLQALSEPDADRDLAGDRSEDVSDLRVRARRAGSRTVAITVRNAGRRTADLPRVGVDAAGRWRECALSGLDGHGRPACRLRALAPGASARVRFRLARPGAARVEVAAEGPDERPADNLARAG